jgi:uncharacterized membrane protein YbhN (UPF0104 family)
MWGVLVLCAAFVALRHAVEFERLAQLLRDAQPRWLLAAAVLQACTYCLAALVWRQALRAAGVSVPYRTLVPLSVAKLFSEEAVPSAGISGTAFFVAALGRRGIPAAACMGTLLLSLVSYYAAYALMALATFVVMRMHQATPWWIATTVMAFMALAICLPIVVFLIKAGARLPLPRWLVARPAVAGFLRMLRQAPGDLARRPSVLLPAVLLHAGIFVLDACTLWMALRAVGHATSFWIAFPAFMMGAMVAAMSAVPMGLGTFEAACVVTLSLLGVSLPSAFAATLLLRGFTLWLPMIPGVLLLRRALR